MPYMGQISEFLCFEHQEGEVRVACHLLAIKSNQIIGGGGGENWDSVGQRSLHPELDQRSSA